MKEAPPAHLSIDDPDYDRDVGSLIEIRLDGETQRDVIAYDCKAGVLRRHARDDRGLFRVDNGDVVIECCTGVVTVSWKDAP